jgi:Rod binding domain-containing protein
VTVQASDQAGARASALPPVNSALEPQWVRKGSASTHQAYQSAPAFEEMLIEQMTSTLGETGSAGSEGTGSEGTGGEAEGSPPMLGGSIYSSLLPQALSKGIVAGGGLGLAAQLTRELQGAQPAGSSNAAVPGAAGPGSAGAGATGAGTTAGASGGTSGSAGATAGEGGRTAAGAGGSAG